jgi:site-specific DNA-methyltransferase (adenine-specific)
MVSKTLKKMEVLRGFIQIPTESHYELIGDVSLPCSTRLNGNPAKLDKYGRLWSLHLKNRFLVGTKVELSRTENGYVVASNENAQKHLVSEKRQREVNLGSPEFDNTTVTPCSEAYFQAGPICVFNSDILKISALQNNSIDLTVTSPPYNVDIIYETYDDRISYDKYLEFSEKWLSKCYSLTRDDGRLCLNIPLDKNKGGQQSVCADLTTIAKEVGWKYHATIIWNEQNISRRTAWGSWMSASAPFVIAPVEVIVVLYKKRWKKTSGSGKSNITRDEFLEWTNAVWNFSGESKNKIGHPSPFPIELPKRCIKLFSYVGDLVLDPFLGSGTTLIACLETERKGIGIEIDRSYCELAVKRLKKYGIEQQKLID